MIPSLFEFTPELTPEQQKIQESIRVLAALGLPRAQLNERSALTLLGLLNLKPAGSWQELERPMMGVTPLMDWFRQEYKKDYAPNSRETVRRQTLHQFRDGGLVLYNPDKPDRPVNSGDTCYQITTELFEVLCTFSTESWTSALQDYLAKSQTLTQQYAKAREMVLIPLTVGNGEEIKLSAGAHSQLIYDIITDFGPRFAPGSEVIYVGDTGSKTGYFKRARLEELGVTVDKHGKMPDVVLYYTEKHWLVLIESVTSHGPVDGKRHGELSKLFASSKAGLVYVTAFPDRKTMGRYLGDISWETEVWIADAPTHMVHFNGDRFLGPH
jgi:adenine-specific DNA-methyltransferase